MKFLPRRSLVNSRYRTLLTGVMICLTTYLFLQTISRYITRNSTSQHTLDTFEKILETQPLEVTCTQYWRSQGNFKPLDDFNDTLYLANLPFNQFELTSEELARHSQNISDSLSTAKKIKQYIQYTRIFGQCYVKNAFKCSKLLESKIFPWLNFNPPLLKKDGDVHEAFNFKSNLEDTAFIRHLKTQVSGRGIVVTANDRHYRELIHLIGLLRALETKMPLQIVHKGDISEFSQQAIMKFAQGDFLGERKIFDLLHGEEARSKFLPLQVQFLDISPSIKPEFANRFVRFSNKLLATVFSTFEEIILIDVDTVPLVPLASFFDMEGYKTSGAFYFKDRSLGNRHNENDTMPFFTSLMPSKFEVENLGIKYPTDYTFKNRYFGSNYSHYMESGLVVLNRQKHLEGIILGLLMTFYDTTVMHKVWGDKELYWLGLSLAGDEEYVFNSPFAGAVGEITPTLERSHYPNYKGLNEICTNHPAHVASDLKTLLWLNTGFKYCKKLIHYDPNNPFFKGWSVADIDAYSAAPLKINALVIPPEPSEARRVLADSPTQNEPRQGWESRGYCEAYTLCAYDRVKGNKNKGYVHRFSQEQQDWFDYLGNVWIKSRTVMQMLLDSSN